jgi:cold-inducible RNA-binding protein
MMGKRLYVGSLPFETTDAQLQELFSSCGRVESAKVIMDRVSGRSKGFGFVEMATDLEAQAAIQKFNGSMVGSRTIVVNEARPMEDRKGGGGGFQGNRNSGGRREGGFGGGNREGGFGGNRREGGFGGGGNKNGGFGGGRDDFGGGGRRRDGHRNGGRKNRNDEDFGNRW